MADGTDTPVETPQGEPQGDGGAGPEGQAQETQAEPQEQAQPQEAQEPDPVQQLEERLFQKMASWTGRREQELMKAVGTIIEQRIPKQAVAAEQGAEPTIYDNPDAWLERKMERKNAEKAQFFQKAIMTAAGEVLNNPALAANKQDIAREIHAAAPRMRMDLPPEIAGAMLAKEAALNYFTKKAGQPVNPLAGNKPTGAALGGLKGNSAKTATKTSVPKDLSPAAQRYIKWAGLGQEELEGYFKE